MLKKIKILLPYLKYDIFILDMINALIKDEQSFCFILEWFSTSRLHDNKSFYEWFKIYKLRGNI